MVESVFPTSWITRVQASPAMKPRYQQPVSVGRGQDRPLELDLVRAVLDLDVFERAVSRADDD